MIQSELLFQTKSFLNHVLENYDPNKPLIFWIDLFSGAGGTSTGIHLANQSNVYVAACVNHDQNAIKSHALNHPNTLHFTEDIRDFQVVENLQFLVNELRKVFPGCKLKIWASLECTNFSKAKGGMARDADSRTLAEHMTMYMALNPDVFWFENVREFMAWGPLDENGKPISKRNGTDYMKWIETIKAFGYSYDFRLLNSADFGAYQSRERLFIQFPKKGIPYAWPEQTHSKKGNNQSLFDMPKWKAVKEVLDLQDEGQSIFSRKKPLSENTEKRILAGLEKFVAKGEPNFIKKYFSGRPKGKVTSINDPSGTVMTVSNAAIVKCHLNTYYGNGGVHSIENPSPSVTTKDRVAKVDVHFIDQQYGNSKPATIDLPVGSITGNPKFALVSSQFIMNQYTSGGEFTDIDSVCSTVTNVPKQNLISADKWILDTSFNNVGRSINEPSKTLVASRRHPYLINANSSTTPPLELDIPSPSITQRTHLIINPSWFGHASDVNNPSCTIIARQDKSPLYLLAVENGDVAWIVFDDDSPTMLLIKEFMVKYSITDIKMRMLKIPELLQIQGFPKDYKLIGTKTEQKKYIGNAVEVNMAKALAFADYEMELKMNLAA